MVVIVALMVPSAKLGLMSVHMGPGCLASRTHSRLVSELAPLAKWLRGVVWAHWHENVFFRPTLGASF